MAMEYIKGAWVCVVVSSKRSRMHQIEKWPEETWIFGKWVRGRGNRMWCSTVDLLIPWME